MFEDMDDLSELTTSFLKNFYKKSKNFYNNRANLPIILWDKLKKETMGTTSPLDAIFPQVKKTRKSDLLKLIENGDEIKSNIDIFLEDNKMTNFDDMIGNINSKLNSDTIIDNRKFHNSSVGDLIKSGPNLLSNMFDVYFTIYKDDSEEVDKAFLVLATQFDKGEDFDVNSFKLENFSLHEKHKVLASLTEDVFALSVRTANVSIPQRKINTTSIPFEGTNINIPTSDWTVANEANLSVTLDSNLYIYDIFNNLAGLTRNGYYVEDTANHYERTNNNYKVMAPSGIRPNAFKVNLTVAAHSLTGFQSSEFTGHPFSNHIRFEFEDIRFMGVSDDISFSNSSGQGKAVNVPFIFKDIRTVFSEDVASINTKASKHLSVSQSFIRRDSYNYS